MASQTSGQPSGQPANTREYKRDYVYMRHPLTGAVREVPTDLDSLTKAMVEGYQQCPPPEQ